MGQKKIFLSLIFKNKKKNNYKLILAQVTFPDFLSRSIFGKSVALSYNETTKLQRQKRLTPSLAGAKK